jgi:hypothetical protein
MAVLPAVLPIVAWARTTAPEAGPQPIAHALSFYKVVVDRRFPDSVAFGAEMTRLGAPVHTMQGDITDLWYHDLDRRWRQGPVAIAGMTAHGPLFCLERLAWDHGMRVVLRTEHPPAADGAEPLISWVIAEKNQELG